MDSELRKAAGEEVEGEGDKPAVTPTSSATLVTAHGTYATQSALTTTTVSKEEKM